MSIFTPETALLLLVAALIIYRFRQALGVFSRLSELKRDGEPDVLCILDDAPEMADAIRTARGSVPSLAERIPALLESGAVVSIKMPFDVEGGTEHIWVSARSYRDGQFHGELDNVPVGSDGWAIGDKISIAPDEISDWMVFQDGRIYGAFTLHALRSLSTGRQRAELEEQLGDAMPEQPILLPQPNF